MTAPLQIGTAGATSEPGTEYTILGSTDGSSFVVTGGQTARDANAAIRQHLEGVADVDATYVAVPARSWKPVKVKTEIALKFGDAS